MDKGYAVADKQEQIHHIAEMDHNLHIKDKIKRDQEQDFTGAIVLDYNK